MSHSNNLHLVQRSPFTHSSLKNCLNVASENDSILLMQDGVFALQQSLNPKQAIYAIKADCLARGLDTNLQNVQYLSMDEMVTLCSQHKQSISWF